MTSEHIRADIANLKARLADNERQLSSAPDVGTGLELEREHGDLINYLTRLESQLVRTEADEVKARKEQEQLELEGAISDLYAQATDVKGDMGELMRHFTPELQRLYDALVPLRDELVGLNSQHESAWLKRHGDWPARQDALLGSGSFLPGVGTNGDLEKIAAFALQLLHNKRTGHGPNLENVYQALSHQSRTFGVY